MSRRRNSTRDDLILLSWWFSVIDLRQSILKRAFSGKLIPQDPSDEPASELLARIQTERTEQEALAKSTQTAKKKTKKKTARKFANKP